MEWLVIAILLLFVMLLQRRQMKKLNRIAWRLRYMATQEQVDTIVNKLTNVQIGLNNVASDTTELKRLLEEANQNPAIDLTEALALVDQIESQVTTMDASFPEAPTPEPTTEPTDPENPIS